MASPLTRREIKLVLFLTGISVILVGAEMAVWSTLGVPVALMPWVTLGLGLVLGLSCTERQQLLGLTLGDVRQGLLAIGVGAPIAIASGWSLVALSASARIHYAGHPTSPTDLLVLYLPGILAAEIIFRGVLLFGLSPRFGPVGAGLVATLAYGLSHVDKPAPEALGSIPVGLLLCFVARWTGSVWYGLVLHLSGAVALTLLAQR